MIYLLIPAVVVFVFFSFGYFLSAPRYSGPVTDHFDGKKFINPGHVEAKGFGDVLKWMTQRKRSPWRELTQTGPSGKPPEKVETGVTITFINHSTFLIQTEGVNILTDPVFSNRTSPFNWMGPKRMRPPGVNFEDIPKIDLILLSHNHYDHLDIATLRKFWKRDQPHIATALGVSLYLNKNHLTSTTDLDWWKSTNFRGLAITAVPAQHFSARGMFDRDATLWCGFAIKLKTGYLYFAGDTGYNESTFREIGQKFSPIEIAMIPIGAYKPKWFMSPIHCSPEEALKIHRDAGAKKSIATHFGTFPLADDGQTEPVEELKNHMEDQGIPAEDFLVLQEGKPHQV